MECSFKKIIKPWMTLLFFSRPEEKKQGSVRDYRNSSTTEHVFKGAVCAVIQDFEAISLASLKLRYNYMYNIELGV